jgi:hypothetical protein
VVVTLGLLATTPAAHAQAIFVSVGGGTEVSELATKVRVTGAVSVDFRRDGESGTVTWDPAGRAQLLTIGFLEHGRRYETGFLSFGGGDPDAAPSTSARVRRVGADGATAGLCADAGTTEFQAVESPERRGSSVELALISRDSANFFSGDSFRTRCAGPTAADIRPSLPRRIVAEKALRQGGFRVDLSGDQPLSAPGLTGTVHSTVVLHVGRTHDLLADDSDAPPATHNLRRRAIRVIYRIESVSGQVVTSLHGLDDPDLCGPLDACGLMGSVTTVPDVRSGRVVLSAIAPLRRSRLDLRRAVGLAPGGAPRGVDAFANGFWSHDRGTVTSALERAGAAGGCSDSVAAANAGGLSLDIAGKRVKAGFGNPLYAASDMLRTRCAGPGLADVAGSGSLATTTFPLTRFARRRLTLHLTTGRAWSAEGYRGTTDPDVSVVLRRIRVRQYVESTPVPIGFFRRSLP